MMQLLDAILSFALTMAALATVVTVIMEAGLRMARMRKKNLIEVMKLLNEELKKSLPEMKDKERRDFFVQVVNNPAEASIKEIKQLKNKWESLTSDQLFDHLGRNKADTRYKRLVLFLRGIVVDKKWASLFEKVSLEYMLHCLADTPSVKQASLSLCKSERLKIRFNRIARKYEEFGSSVSASFKRQAQVWSIGIGIALAIVANIHGLRIFEAYRLNPDLAAVVIEKQSEFLTNQEAASKRTEEFIAIEARLKQAREALAEAEVKGANAADVEKLKQQVAQANAELKVQSSSEKIQQAAIRAQQQIDDLTELGIPIGWEFYPRCPFGEDNSAWTASSPECRAIPEKERGYDGSWVLYRICYTFFSDFWGGVIWFFIVVITGIFIGLGAPFWFDVAKRVSQIRKGLQKPSASAEYRLAGKDANGKSEDRKKIVESVLEQAAVEAKMASTSTPKERESPSSDGTVSPEGE